MLGWGNVLLQKKKRVAKKKGTIKETLEQAESQKVEGKYKDQEEQTNSFNI